MHFMAILLIYNSSSVLEVNMLGMLLILLYLFQASDLSKESIVVIA